MNYRIIFYTRPTTIDTRPEYALVKNNYVMYMPGTRVRHLREIIGKVRTHFEENSNIHQSLRLTKDIDYQVLTTFNKKTYKEALDQLELQYPEYMI